MAKERTFEGEGDDYDDGYENLCGRNAERAGCETMERGTEGGGIRLTTRGSAGCMLDRWACA